MTATTEFVIDPFGLADTPRHLWSRQSTFSEMGNCQMRPGHAFAHPDQYRTGEAPVMGTGYHAGIAEFYRARQEGRVATRAQMHDASDAAIAAEIEAATTFRWNAWNERTIRELARDCIDAYVDGEHFWHPMYEVIAVEVQVFLPPSLLEGLHADWAIEIQLDLVLLEPHSGRHILVDHKTSRRKWDANKHRNWVTPQPTWYQEWWPVAWAHTEEGKGQPAPAMTMFFDVMQHQGFNFMRREADDITDAHRKHWLDTAVATTALLQYGAPLIASPDSRLCDPRWCDWWDVCPAGESLRIANIR